MIRLITRNADGDVVGIHEIEGEVHFGYDGNGELVLKRDEDEDTVSIELKENVFVLSSKVKGVSVMGETLLSQEEIKPFQYLLGKLEKQRENLKKKFVSRQALNWETEREVRSLSEFVDVNRRAIAHYETLNVINGAINRLEGDEKSYGEVKDSLKGKVEFDEYTKIDNHENLLKALEDLNTIKQNSPPQFIRCEEKIVADEDLVRHGELLEKFLIKADEIKDKALPVLLKKHEDMSACDSFDDVVDYFQHKTSENRRVSQVSIGSIIDLGNGYSIEVNHITGPAGEKKRQNAFSPEMSYHEVDDIIQKITKSPKIKEMVEDYVRSKVPDNQQEEQDKLRLELKQEVQTHMSEIRNILRYDSRLLEFNPSEGKGQILCRQGDFGNTAYYVVEGEVEVLLNSEEHEKKLDKSRKKDQKSFFGTIAQLWTNRHGVREWRKESREKASSRGGKFLNSQDFPEILQHSEGGVIVQKAGALIGEISAMGRVPRTATMLVKKPAKVLELRWQGLRDLRESCRVLKDITDASYRERGLSVHLNASGLFDQLSEEDLKKLINEVEFCTFGRFDWQGSYKSLEKNDDNAMIASEPVVAAEGQYPDALVMIRSGFARISQVYNHGHRTVSYVGKGSIFGLEELRYNHLNPKDPICYQYSLTALGYVDVLLIPKAMVEELIFKRGVQLEGQGIKSAVEGKGKAFDLDTDPGIIENLVSQRVINGTATMLIDMDRCTRCDDCVRACASSHGGNPRFRRQGNVINHFMVANACMHCNDPVCMIGCPTGAIHRNLKKGEVTIYESQCIGCATCANSCPYDNIQMVEITENSRTGEAKLGADNEPVRKATKCDLCFDQKGGPACERACPHGALERLSVSDIPTFESWLDRHEA